MITESGGIIEFSCNNQPTRRMVMPKPPPWCQTYTFRVGDGTLEVVFEGCGMREVYPLIEERRVDPCVWGAVVPGYRFEPGSKEGKELLYHMKRFFAELAASAGAKTITRQPSPWPSN